MRKWTLRQYARELLTNHRTHRTLIFFLGRVIEDSCGVWLLGHVKGFLTESDRMVRTYAPRSVTAEVQGIPCGE